MFYCWSAQIKWKCAIWRMALKVTHHLKHKYVCLQTPRVSENNTLSLEISIKGHPSFRMPFFMAFKHKYPQWIRKEQPLFFLLRHPSENVCNKELMKIATPSYTIIGLKPFIGFLVVTVPMQLCRIQWRCHGPGLHNSSRECYLFCCWMHEPTEKSSCNSLPSPENVNTQRMIFICKCFRVVFPQMSSEQLFPNWVQYNLQSWSSGWICDPSHKCT